MEKPDPLSFFNVLGGIGDWWQVDVYLDSPAWVFGPSIALNNRIGEMQAIPVLSSPSPLPAGTVSPTPLTRQKAEETASEVLITFFDHLRAREYAQAVRLFGGGYGIVRMWNEDVDPQDFQTLMLRGCEWNGFNCSLQVSQVLETEQISPLEYRIQVEFQTEAGDLFKFYNMADPDALPKTSFTFTVIQDCDGKFYVIDWPIYTS